MLGVRERDDDEIPAQVEHQLPGHFHDHRRRGNHAAGPDVRRLELPRIDVEDSQHDAHRQMQRDAHRPDAALDPEPSAEREQKRRERRPQKAARELRREDRDPVERATRARDREGRRLRGHERDHRPDAEDQRQTSPGREFLFGCVGHRVSHAERCESLAAANTVRAGRDAPRTTMMRRAVLADDRGVMEDGSRGVSGNRE
jgi:hypothetical protein